MGLATSSACIQTPVCVQAYRKLLFLGEPSEQNPRRHTRTGCMALYDALAYAALEPRLAKPARPLHHLMFVR